ncbi:hypothetical protein WG66_016730 [Moniliophthora roreri]|nr:hypothetical protein WG66_016730 [Moniliophthora roreri]
MEPYQKPNEIRATLAYYIRGDMLRTNESRSPPAYFVHSVSDKLHIVTLFLQVEADIGALSIPSCSE